MSNKLTLSNIYQVIDNHIESETQFMFVTDKNLAELICEYVADNYNLYDEDMELSDKYKDYYVSLYYDEGGVSFYCETARGISGEYKFADAMEDHVDYFVCNGMSEHDVNIKLQGENCTWSWIDLKEDKQEYVDDCEDEDLKDNELEEQCDCLICEAEQEVKQLDCYCEDCSNDYMKDFIDECLEVIFSGDACSDCIVKSVVELAFKCKELGRQSVKQEIGEILED